jgi:transposase InsO family protein
MKNDEEVKLFLRERKKGKSQELAAIRAGMTAKTARKYERLGTLPSELKQPRSYRTRPDPFGEDWPWIEAELQRDDALQAKTLFELLCLAQPERYQEGQLRTLQRRVEAWRALKGPEREVMFPQVHPPGRMAQADFTSLNDTSITIAGEPFPHMVFHLVLTYSNYETVSVCFSESFEALSEGLQKGLWQIGGVPTHFRTDNLSAAIYHLTREGRQDFTTRYQALMDHYGMTPTHNNAGVPHENGDVEQAHHRLKTALDQELRVLGSRDFPTRQAYEAFLADVVRRRNTTRAARFAEEQAVLRPLPPGPLDAGKEVRVKVRRFSTITVQNNIYSVPSRLIGCELRVKVRAETLEVFYQGTQVLTLPRLRGQYRHAINYRHVIWSLLRKPGAFAHYCYRDEFFPSMAFRRAYDALQGWHHARGDAHYLRILYLAATLAESEVELALELLLESGTAFGWEDVQALVQQPKPATVPVLAAPVLNLQQYDRLLASRCAHE